MSWRDVDARLLEDSGLLSPDEEVAPPATGWRGGLEDSGLLSPAEEVPRDAAWRVRTEDDLDPAPAPAAERAEDDPVEEVLRQPDPETGLTFDGARRVYALLCAMAHVDGPVAPAQRQELDDAMEFLSLSPFAARVLEQEARRSGTLRLGIRPAELELLMGALIDMAAADGRMTPGERRLLERVNRRARWAQARIDEALERALARAREVTPRREADPAPASDPLGFLEDSGVAAPAAADPLAFLEDSGDGELVLPEQLAPLCAGATRPAPARSEDARGQAEDDEPAGEPDEDPELTGARERARARGRALEGAPRRAPRVPKPRKRRWSA
ncbi:MAG: TerB family tellurite resistance protein [Planctomycetes bacterium]|nr:TerB family tellurite resistance protein [Planctomycetota bacterium]